MTGPTQHGAVRRVPSASCSIDTLRLYKQRSVPPPLSHVRAAIIFNQHPTPPEPCQPLLPACHASS